MNNYPGFDPRHSVVLLTFVYILTSMIYHVYKTFGINDHNYTSPSVQVQVKDIHLCLYRGYIQKVMENAFIQYSTLDVNNRHLHVSCL